MSTKKVELEKKKTNQKVDHINGNKYAVNLHDSKFNM